MKASFSTTENTFSIKTAISEFKEITKFRLAASVVFSSVAGYLLGVIDFTSNSWITDLMLAIGGYCMVGASNAFNQIIEKDSDAKMERTNHRPVPAGRMTPTTAFVVASSLINL